MLTYPRWIGLTLCYLVGASYALMQAAWFPAFAAFTGIGLCILCLAADRMRDQRMRQLEQELVLHRRITTRRPPNQRDPSL